MIASSASGPGSPRHSRKDSPMTRRRRRPITVPDFVPHVVPANVQAWTITTSWTSHGRHVEPGTELSFRGVQGRFRFQRHVRTAEGVEWVDVISDHGFRAFRPDRVKTVHRVARIRANASNAA